MQPDLELSQAGPEATAPGPGPGSPTAAEASVTDLYQAHALRLIRLAYLMLGDRAGAEDVVQEAFCGLYRRWPRLADPGRAVPYLRASVLNGCRSQLRRRARPPARQVQQQAPDSAETAVLASEERAAVHRALRRLPDRQREAVLLRYYLDLSAEEAAVTMGIGPSSVRSATHRALAALGHLLQEFS
jgi:RNA polymerase sigma-70 factor (sigma-E family)